MAEKQKVVLDPGRAVNLAIQVLPLVEDPIPVIDQAIAVIAESGVRYEVGPMETVMEGPLDQLLAVARAAHLTCLQSGVKHVVTQIKIVDSPTGTTIDEKVAKYRLGS